MGYKPKYAASSRKRQPDVIRTRPEPERKASRPKREQSRAGRIFQIILTVILVPVCAFATGKHPSHTVRFVPQQSSTTVSLFI